MKFARIEGERRFLLKRLLMGLDFPDFSLHEITCIHLFNGANLAKLGSDELH
jgi:hypothetical protein